MCLSVFEIIQGHFSRAFSQLNDVIQGTHSPSHGSVLR